MPKILVILLFSTMIIATLLAPYGLPAAASINTGSIAQSPIPDLTAAPGTAPGDFRCTDLPYNLDF